MKDVIIYTTKTCPYCYKAKSLLKGLDITYQEVSVDFRINHQHRKRCGTN